MKRTVFLHAFLGSALLAATSAHAGSLYWDSNGTGTAGAGTTPTGTWGSSVFWSTDSTGANVGSPVLTATTTSLDDVFFSTGTDATGAYSVGLNSATQNAKLVTFQEGTVTLSSGTLSLAPSGGLTVTTGTTVGATISSDLTITGNQTFTVGASRTLALNTGTFTRNAGATLNVLNTGTVTSNMTNLSANDSTGIIGNWASFNTGTATTYAKFSGSTITGLGYTGGADGTAVTLSSNVVTGAGNLNYTLNASGTLGASASVNTLRYTGATGTLTTNTSFTTNGLMNASGGALVLSGAVTIGSGNDLVVNANGQITISNPIGGASGATLTKTGAGALFLAGVNTFNGGLVINGGNITMGTNGVDSLGAVNSSVTVNANTALNANNFNTFQKSFVLNNGAIITFSTGSSTVTVTGAVTGTGGIVPSGGNALGQRTLNLSSTANSFSGSIINRNGADFTDLNTNSLYDAAGAGNIIYGEASLAKTMRVTYGSGAITSLTLANRQLEILGSTPLAAFNNNAPTANIVTISTNLLNRSTGAATLQLGGTNTGANIFSGDITNGSGGGSIGISKSEVGNWILSSASNTFTGTITLGAIAFTAPAGGAGVAPPTNTSVGTLSYASAGGTNPIRFIQTTGSATLSYIGAAPLTMSGAITASALSTGTITLDASGTTSANTVHYSNTASLGIAGASGAKTLVLSGSNTGSNILAGQWENNTLGGAAKITKNGVGTWVLTNNTNGYTGATLVSAGTLAGSVAHAFGSTSGISVGNTGGATLSLLSDSSTNFTKTSDSSLYSVTTTSASGVTINADRATAGGNSAKTMGIGTLLLNTAVTNATTFTGDHNTSLSIGAVTTGNSTSGTETLTNNITGGGTLTLASVSVLRTTAPTLRFDGSGNTIVSGAITQTATTALTYAGTGSLTLSGTNSYTGTTTVSSGVLAVNGSLGNTTTTIGNTGTLRGSGSIGGSVTIQSGGTIAAGNSIESLTTGSLSMQAASTFAYEIDKDAVSTIAGDLTAVTGVLTLDLANTAILTLNELGTTGVWTAGEKLTLLSYSGGWNGGLFKYLGGTLNDDSTFTYSGTQWMFNYNDITAGTNYTGDLTNGGVGVPSYVTMTAVPESSAALLGGLGMLILLRRRRNGVLGNRF